MSLPVLIVLVVAGVSLIVLAVHLTGGGRTATIRDEAAVVARFADDYPEETVTECAICIDRANALLFLRSGRLGLVHALGDKFVTRDLGAGDLAQIDRDSEDGVMLRFHDFTWPRQTFRFADAGEADALAARLRRLEA